ncbi:HNH endonuclease signature motif containing protein [Streptomyces sp. NBC_00572]|uniref:HNH endonuclease signature motif containing protein n=1 Tax=Streptomyces sp. NBC_00572 TaxID=2903664 RepID=UPI0022582DE8|nr:HNH endonuclease signature motif containing protein [Streptomyces sp. NBC_00572]MCX4987146.1 HNH endonuclease [Streptomyces sp. NBC_00572]
MNTPERFAAKVDPAGPLSLYRDAPGPCHLWTGGARSKRPHDAGEHGEFYGAFKADGHTVRAHQYAYEQARGPIPAGTEVDHRCRRRNCVNPAHLEVTDHRTNTLRSSGPTAINARKVRCLRGHPFDAANTYVRPNGARACRACRRPTTERTAA